MNKSLRLMMIKSAHERVLARRKWQAQQILFEREVKEIEGDIECSPVKKSLRKA